MLATTVADVVVRYGLKLANEWSDRPLSGKRTVAAVVWVVAWAVFHKRRKSTQVNFSGVFIATLVPIALGLLGTFPPFFEWFGG